MKKIVFISAVLLGLVVIFLSTKFIFFNKSETTKTENNRELNLPQENQSLNMESFDLESETGKEENKMTETQLIHEFINNFFVYESVKNRNKSLERVLTSELYQEYFLPESLEVSDRKIEITSTEIFFSKGNKTSISLVKVDDNNYKYTVVVQMSFEESSDKKIINDIQIYSLSHEV